MRNSHIYKGKYWFVTGEPNCDTCEKEINDGWLCHDWRRGIVSKYLCDECRDNFEDANIGGQEYRQVQIAKIIPPGSIPVMPQPYGISDSKNMSVFEAADKIIDGEEVVDKTVLANRPTPEIEDEKVTTLLETTEDVDDILAFHTTTPPTAITESEKKQIGSEGGNKK